jgi:hypothetical protein
MSDELKEEQETLEPEQETTPESVESPEEDIESLKAEAAKAKEFKGFAEKTAIENKELKKKLKALEDSKKPERAEDSNADERFERLELKTEGYSKEEIDFIMQNGGSKVLETKENNLVLDAIEASRKKKKSQDATPSGTNKSPVYQRYTEQDLKNMSLSELEKIIPR